MRRFAAAAVLLAALGACGQIDPPDSATLQERLSDPNAYFQVTRPDGTQMWCNQYGDESTGSNDSKSWFGYSCDWTGAYPQRER